MPDDYTNKAVFRDLDGNVIASWQVPLSDYLAAYEGSKDDRTRIHRTVVAKALAAGESVPAEIVRDHDAALLQAEREFFERVFSSRRERQPDATQERRSW